MIVTDETSMSDFEIIKTIKEGNIGDLYLSKHTSNDDNLYILKLIQYDSFETVKYGLELAKNLNHPNLSKYYGYFFTISDNIKYVVSVMEYVPGEDLYNFYTNTKSITNMIPNIIGQIVSGLQYIHDQNMIHRDIKLENIIITPDNKVKIIDFDFIVKANDPTVPKCGTPFYISPEIINDKPVDEHIDTWAIGIVIYILLTGRYPFDGSSHEDLYYKILYCDPDYHDINPKYKDLICKILNKNIHKRINLNEISEILDTFK